MLDLSNISGPGDAFAAVTMLLLCALAASYPVIRMIGWLIEGAVEPLVGMVAIGLYLVLTVLAVTAPPAIGVAIFLVILASALVLPFLGRAADVRGHQQIDDEHLLAYTAALERNPADPVARIALAEALSKRGRLQEAIEHMQWTLQAHPRLVNRIRPVLDSWLREQARQAEQAFVYCHQCHSENTPGTTACQQCGAPFGTLEAIQARLAVEGGPVRVLKLWITVAVAVTLSVFVLLVIPSIIAGPIIAAIAIAGAWLFLRWVGGQ